MTTIPNVNSWLDFWAILIVSLIAAVPSWLALRSHKAVQRQSESVQEIKSQVVNGHGDARPLREDIDRLTEVTRGMRKRLDIVGNDVHGLRADLREESEARRAHVGELRSDLAAARAELEHLRKSWLR